jgi:hypothetical protein
MSPPPRCTASCWDVTLDRVHVTRNRRSGGRRTTVLHVHTAGLDVDEVVEVDGVR